MLELHLPTPMITLFSGVVGELRQSTEGELAETSKIQVGRWISVCLCLSSGGNSVSRQPGGGRAASIVPAG